MNTFNMRFLNPKFNTRLISTVRRGERWKDRLKIGEIVSFYTVEEREQELNICHQSPFEKGTVVRITSCRFCDLTIDDLAYTHDRNCKTPEGLFLVLTGCYPSFEKTEVVTVIEFAVKVFG